MRMVRAEGPLFERILDETFPLWHDGLSRDRYGAYNVAQMRTTWGARHLDRVALVDGNRVLASAKRYRLALQVDNEAVPIIGIGAVFTPPAERRRGHAAALIERIVDDAAREGIWAAMLFSEIGPRYYERLGFVSLPMLDADLTVSQGRGAPAMLVRAVEPDDHPHLLELHQTLAARYRLSLRWHRRLARLLPREEAHAGRVLARVGPPGGGLRRRGRRARRGVGAAAGERA